MKSFDCTLYLVTDRCLAGNRSLHEIVLESIRGGVSMVQLREKNLGTRAFLREAISLKAVTDKMGIPLIINDRLDIAMACGAAGVHLGQDDMECALARRIVGEGMILGISASSREEALKAEADGADYVAISPVFSTPTKPDAPAPAGLEGILEIRRTISIPLVAIGGLAANNAAAAIRAGADGIAVVSAIMASPSPRLAARELIAAIGEGKAE